jgi:nucleoside-diphosphate-sugar epimerase
MNALPPADIEHILVHTKDLWEDLRGQRLFVTGGTGFFGCWLLESFLAANDRHGLGASATVLTRYPDRFRQKAPHLAAHPAVSLLTGDVKTFEFPSGDFPFVIHAAAESSTISTDREPLAMFDTIVQGTRRVLDLAVRSGTKKFLLVSSGAVYGVQPPQYSNLPEMYLGAPDVFGNWQPGFGVPVPNPESRIPNPDAAYGEGKRAAELLCAYYRRRGDCEMKIARCFAFVGPHLSLDAHFAIGNFIRDALQGGPIRVRGDGEPKRSYLYAADLAIWLWMILLRGHDCRPYNVGSENAITIGALARLAADTLRPDAKVEIEGFKSTKVQELKGSLPLHYVPSTQRARGELGLAERIDLSEAIRRTAEWEAQRLKSSRAQERGG